MSGEYPDLAEKLDISNPSSWSYQDAFYATKYVAAELQTNPSKDTFLHWTIVYPTLKIKFRNLIMNLRYEKREREAYLALAKKVTVLTLYADASILKERIDLRRKRSKELVALGRRSRASYLRHLVSLFYLESIYSKPDKINHLYDLWFKFCRHMNVNKHYIVNVNEKPTFDLLSHWDNRFG